MTLLANKRCIVMDAPLRDLAMRYGHNELFLQLVQQHPLLPADAAQLWLDAAEGGSVAILQYLYEHIPLTGSSSRVHKWLTMHALRHSRYEATMWLCDHLHSRVPAASIPWQCDADVKLWPLNMMHWALERGVTWSPKWLISCKDMALRVDAPTFRSVQQAKQASIAETASDSAAIVY